MSGEIRKAVCAECGSDDLWAWYPEYTRQSIEGEIEDGEVTFDYTGVTDGADDAGENDQYMCGNCQTLTESLEELVGLPAPPLLGRTLTEWEVLGMLLPMDGDNLPDPDQDFPSGADFIDMVCRHFGWDHRSFPAYIERLREQQELQQKARA